MWDEEKKEVHILFRPDKTWCSFDGVVHGGIVASVSDEAMGWAVRKSVGASNVTADFHIRYRRPVLVGGEYTAKARAEETHGRKTRASAQIVNAKGDVFAEADALFIVPRDPSIVRAQA
jgi:uncharacterized protein (TIGR00369 family)